MHQEWKIVSESLLAGGDWCAAIEILEKEVADNPENMEAYIRLLFILHEYLLEHAIIMDYDYQSWTDKLVNYFNISLAKFKEDAVYQFFMGERTHITYYHFGLKNTDLAVELERKAYEHEPENKLYQWSYRCFNSYNNFPNQIRTKELAHFILYESDVERNWLKEWGYPGREILATIAGSNSKWWLT